MCAAPLRHRSRHVLPVFQLPPLLRQGQLCALACVLFGLLHVLTYVRPVLTTYLLDLSSSAPLPTAVLRPTPAIQADKDPTCDACCNRTPHQRPPRRKCRRASGAWNLQCHDRREDDVALPDAPGITYTLHEHKAFTTVSPSFSYVSMLQSEVRADRKKLLFFRSMVVGDGHSISEYDLGMPCPYNVIQNASVRQILPPFTS